MTNEEAIDVLKNDIEICTIQQKQACEMAIKALEQLQDVHDTCKNCIEFSEFEQQPRWIPVSERLPEPNVAVLTYINTGATETYCLAYWNDACEAWEEWIGIDLIEKDKGYKVIAWRELPEPY